ncbi:hypothetical protein AALC25_08525 [Lachnospiraceae bacterium 29-84]
MGLFRKKRKPQYVEEILEFEGQAPQEPRKEERQGIAAEYCQQILDASKYLEEAKREYQLVTEYLLDIQRIEQISEKDMAEIRDTAQSIVMLHQSREAYQNKEKTISDAQYAQMEQLEEEMPEIINRLKSNEAYQSVVKRDMQYLEGEKGEWQIYLESMEREVQVLHKLLYGLVGGAVAAIAAILGLHMAFEFDLGMAVMLASLVLGGIGALMALRMQNDRIGIKRAGANINRAIVLLNKVKFKYVNITNAVDYACERYHVKNAYELNYIWEQYLEAVKEMERYQRANDDLEFFSGRLSRQLHKYGLYDAKIWTHQSHALVDKKEMVEVKHALLVRRQNMRARMERQVADIQAAKTEIAKLVKDAPGNEKIKDILESVDQVCRMAVED